MAGRLIARLRDQGLHSKRYAAKILILRNKSLQRKNGKSQFAKKLMANGRKMHEHSSIDQKIYVSYN